MRIGFTTKSKSGGSRDYQNWGMGFLLVFFPEEEGAGAGTTIINKKKSQSNHHGVLSSSHVSSSSSTTSPSSNKSTVKALLKRSNSVHLLSRAQSTISICALLIFITLLLFTLSTFEPSTSHHHNFSSRRQLVSRQHYLNNKNNANFVGEFNNGQFYAAGNEYSSVLSRALQGMGTLYRRGTRAMNDLIVAHVVESLSVHELRLFIRVFHSSNLASRSDLLFIFPSKSKSASSFDTTILEENDSFLKFIDRYRELDSLNSTGGFDVNQFVKRGDKKGEILPETIWGRRTRGNLSEGGNRNNNNNNNTELTRLSYGSVVGFDVDELDPENSLAGFLDHVPMSLRRWACYPMLLGRLRRNFKHIVLLDAKEMLLFGDPLSRVRSTSPESVFLSSGAAAAAAAATTHSSSSKHSKKNSEKTQATHSKSVSPTIITGGARGVRRLSNAMLTEIARQTMQHKKKNSVTESGLFNQLVGNEFLLKNVKLITSKEPIPELSSLTGYNSKPGSKLTVVRRGNSNFDVNSTVVKYILCSDSSFYSHC